MINLNKDKTLLLVVDIQERLAKSMPQDRFEAMLQKTKTLISGFHTLKIPIIQTLQYKKGLGESVEGLFESHIGQIDIEKRVFSCYYQHSELMQYLLQNPHIRQIIITGMEAHICVWQTARDLLASHYEVVVMRDCVISRDVDNKRDALRLIAQCGGFVMNVESVLFDLLKTSCAEEFRAISQLIK